MPKFKVGDKVKRIKGSYNDMEIGDTAIVTSVDERGIELTKYNRFSDYHSISNFELIEQDWDD